MSSLLEKIKASRASNSSRPDIISAESINIRGSGLTKREALKNTREYERETKKALKIETAQTDLIQQAEADFQAGIDATVEILREAQKRKNIQLDDSQLRAVAGIAHNRVSVLIGAAGTGKTTVTGIVVDELAKRVNVVNLSALEFVTVETGPKQKERITVSEAIKRGFKADIYGKSIKDERSEMPGIAFAAYTGRATQQMKRALPQEWHGNASTIHKLLGYAPTFEEVEDFDTFGKFIGLKTIRRFRPTFGEAMKLPFTLYVLDEASMVPIPLFNELIDAMPENSRILLIGDINQLPPVMGKSILGYAMRKWPVFELTTIHRQAAGNPIIANAHRVLSGKLLEEAANFKIISNTPGGKSQLEPYFLKIIRKLADLNRYDPLKDAIIVPQNVDLCGAITLNEKLVTMFNPEEKINGITVNKRMNIHTGTNHAFFAIRDKVMITSNINNVDPPITNGMIGIVETITLNGRYDLKRSQVEDNNSDDGDDDPLEIDLDLNNVELALGKGLDDEKEKAENDESADQRQSSHVLTIKFENGQSFTASTAGDFRKITHGYAATCHKSQGGEYPNVIILCHSVNARMLSQEWLYTAITRARNNVYLVCNERGLTQALTQQRIKGRTIKEKIQSFIMETCELENGETGYDREKYPILWEAEKI